MCDRYDPSLECSVKQSLHSYLPTDHLSALVRGKYKTCLLGCNNEKRILTVIFHEIGIICDVHRLKGAERKRSKSMLGAVRLSIVERNKKIPSWRSLLCSTKQKKTRKGEKKKESKKSKLLRGPEPEDAPFSEHWPVSRRRSPPNQSWSRVLLRTLRLS